MLRNDKVIFWVLFIIVTALIIILPKYKNELEIKIVVIPIESPE